MIKALLNTKDERIEMAKRDRMQLKTKKQGRYSISYN